MSEAAFSALQIGAQSALGSAVAAAVIFPVEPGTEFKLDRHPGSPDEDFSIAVRH